MGFLSKITIVYRIVVKRLLEEYSLFIRDRELVKKHSYVMKGAILYPSVKMGMYSYVSHNTIIANTIIGNYCSIGPNSTIGFGDHPVNLFSTSPFIYKNKNIFGDHALEYELINQLPVKIGNDVWIGANVFVKNGIIIGDGVIIGAGAVVLNDLDAYGIYVGVPAKKIKNRKSDFDCKDWFNYELGVIECEKLNNINL